MQPVIDARELARRIDDGNAPVVLHTTVLLAPARFDGDYRPESGLADWREAHIPGSRHVDLLGTLSDPDARLHFTRPTPQRLAADLAALGIGPDDEIVLYDQGTMTWSARVWWLLRSVGRQARVLDGGFAAWTAQGLPVESGDTAPEPIPVAPAPLTYHPLWVDRDEVLAISEGRAPGTLVCALDAAVFDGSKQTRYSRRGHIAGSRNLPSKSLLDESGRLVDVDALAALAAPLAEAPAPVVLYCGGGVSACLAALGLVLAGHDDPQVYDGSLEEWTADPSLPMTTTADGAA